MWGSVRGSGLTTPSTLPPGSLCRTRRRNVLSSTSSWQVLLRLGPAASCSKILGSRYLAPLGQSKA
ncbi:hypothetical protein LINPERHAP1_LOCUS16101 [Linum perenne]